jgi:hypothetical protein
MSVQSLRLEILRNTGKIFKLVRDGFSGPLSRSFASGE